jgi:C4-dicarboxylate-binding protein DctP
MKKRETWLVALLVVLALAVALGIPGGNAFAQKKPVVLRLVVPSPAGDRPLTTMNEDLAKRFNERTRGEYKMEVHAGGALAKLPEYFDAIRVGAIEMACAPWPVYSFLDPRFGVMEIPFLFNNNDAANYGVAASLPLYDKILQEKFNAKGLGFFNTGGLELWTTSKPVKTLEDWKGLLTAAISPTVASMTKDLGGSPVTIMWPDMYEALQKKVVDGAVHSTHGGLAFSFPDVCKHVTLFFGIDGSNGYSINLDVWKKMPPNIQKILREEVKTTMEWYRKNLPKMDKDDVRLMKQKGTNVYFLSQSERERWVKATAGYREKQLASVGEFGAKIKQIADEANKKYPYKPQRQ